MPHHEIKWGSLPSQDEIAQATTSMLDDGPRMLVSISITDKLGAALQALQQSVPPPVSGEALIDTGASDTTIDDAAATELGLPVIDTIRIATPSDVRLHNVYAVRLTFPGTYLPAIPFQRVAGTSLANQGIVALLGRDFLDGKILHYDGVSHSVMLSW